VLTGAPQAATAMALQGIVAHEGVYARVAAALVTLAAGDPSGGWEAFIDRAMMANPEQAIRWPLVMAAGHSQGGGHAALLGRRHPLARVIALASPCDRVGAASARWLVNDGSYATDPTTRFFGLGAQGDTICAGYPAAWESLRMPASARQSDAVVCAGDQPHGAPIGCVENASRWERMLQR
jgi:hypothetical protein